jgi:hypothetical protein
VGSAGARRRTGAATLERAVRSVEARWTLIERPGEAAAALRLRVDLASGSCRLERRAAGGGPFVCLRADAVAPGSIEVEAGAGRSWAVTVPGVLAAVGLSGRGAGYARSPWVDGLSPRAGCCAVVGLAMG